MSKLSIITYSLLIIHIKHAIITTNPTYTNLTFATTNKLVKITIIIFNADD
jgi:hypothetical protein